MSATAEPSRARFSIAQLILALPWIVLVIDAWAPIRDNSFLWHIRAGAVQSAAGSVLTEDPFSFTMLGEQWLTQSWLIELLYAWLEGRSGLGFVPLMLFSVGAIFFVSVGLIAYKHSKSVSAAAVIVLLTAVLIIGFLVPRPVIFSFALFGLVILAWDQPALRYTVPFLFWIWASVHGSFAIGLAYIVLSVVAERQWRATATVFASGVASLLTAHGLGVLQMLIDFGRSREVLDYLVEWRSPEIFSAVTLPFAIGIALVVVGAARGTIVPRHLVLIVPFLALGLGATRAIPPAWMALLPLVSRATQGWTTGTRKRFSPVAAGLYGLLVLVLPLALVEGAELDPERFPLEASENLSDVRTFHDDVAGGYLIWESGPERKVYIDDRAELYAGRIVEFVEVRDGREPWEPVFRRDGIEQVMLRSDEELLGALLQAGWRRTFDDGVFAVMRPGN